MQSDQRLKDDRIDIELKELDREILRYLLEGRCTPGYLSDETGEKPSWISKRLGRLVDDGSVSRVAHGLYELDEAIIDDGGNDE